MCCAAIRHPAVSKWRETADPYHILVSEVMLQQTQVDRVLPKYLEWLEKFPSLEALAAADEGLVAELQQVVRGPLVVGAEILGVIEFFSRQIREPDADLLEMMVTLGGQIGHEQFPTLLQFRDLLQASTAAPARA